MIVDFLIVLTIEAAFIVWLLGLAGWFHE